MTLICFFLFCLQIFVVLVVLLVTFVVVITYICILPVKLSHSVWWVVYHFVVGHWLLVNIVFHYFRAAFTNPGHVPEVCAYAYVYMHIYLCVLAIL